MGSYLEQYGAGDERRIRIVKTIVFSAIGVAIAAVAAYVFFQNYSEKQTAKHFLDDVNAHRYEAAYRDWGCTPEHPCPNYNYNRFLEDWGPAKSSAAPWKVASIDGCRMFVTVNVQAEGSELQSLSVARENKELGYAPAPECQERQLHIKQFFKRLFGGST